jgi:hypothetical protein
MDAIEEFSLQGKTTMPTPDETLDVLRKAISGLTYPSESEEPFDVFVWPGNGTARDQVAEHAGKGRRIEEVPVETFFTQLDEADDAPRYRQLQGLLVSLLKDLAIFRAGGGEVRVDVYLLGKMSNGQWAGLHTVSVET